MRAGGLRTALVALAAAALVAGCGGDDDGDERPAAPRSVEQEQATLDRLGEEVEGKRCRDPKAVFHSRFGPMSSRRCWEFFRAFESFALGDLRPYGPAAVVAFGEAGVTTVGLVLDRDRRYRIVALTRKYRARPTPESDRLAERAVVAMADQNCTELAALAGETGNPCDLKQVTDFSRAADLAGDPPKPRRLGGEGGIAFYEAAVADRFYVVVLVEGRGGKLTFANVYPAG